MVHRTSSETLHELKYNFYCGVDKFGHPIVYNKQQRFIVKDRTKENYVRQAV